MADWMPGCPVQRNNHMFDDPPGPSGLNPQGAVTHRTIGHWGGDLSVLTRGRVPSCHFLIGEDDGQWCQMVPVNVIANHAAGANQYAVGIEISGDNGSSFTPWQIARARDLVDWLVSIGVPRDRYVGDARVDFFNGFIDHLFVNTDPSLQHFDYWNTEDWNAVSASKPTPPRKKRKPMLYYRDPKDGAIYSHDGIQPRHIPSSEEVNFWLALEKLGGNVNAQVVTNLPQSLVNSLNYPGKP